MIKKPLLILSTTMMLGLGSIVTVPSVQAESISSQRAGIQAQISEKNNEISAAQAELARLSEQFQRAEQAVIDNQNMITKTESDIAAANLEIQKTQEEIDSLKAAIEKRNDILKERARTYQETGGNVQYLEVLFGSNSFANFVERVEAVAQIMNADKSMMEQHEADVKAVEVKQAAVKAKLAELEDMKLELDAMRAQVLEQKHQNDAIKAELQQKEAAGLSAKASLQKQDRSLASQEAKMNAPKTSPLSFAPTAFGGDKINIVTNVGRRYIGNSVYVFGGGRSDYDVANGRFDCSGFVHWSFAQAGISIGASTDSLKNSGRRVSTSEMRPGDLVFFNTYKTDGHVGIYLGGGSFIGSQSSTGVAIANMNSGYWADTFNGRVVRIIE
jgi:peptidoglycan DL-endopeptidase CwlO